QRHLLRDDLVRQPAAHREVGVTEGRVFLGQPFGDPVGPAAEVAVVAGVVQAFGEAVTERDEGSVMPHDLLFISANLVLRRGPHDCSRWPVPARATTPARGGFMAWR